MKDRKFSSFRFGKQRVPEIYTAIAISFDKNADIEQIKTELKIIGISDIKIEAPKCSNELDVVVFETRSKNDWYLNDVISKMFSNMNCSINELGEIITKHNGNTYIDIAFWHYKTYPALEISKENIKKMNLLNASLGIDPY